MRTALSEIAGRLFSQSLSKDWQEELHPRGEGGRFAHSESGGVATLPARQGKEPWQMPLTEFAPYPEQGFQEEDPKPFDDYRKQEKEWQSSVIRAVSEGRLEPVEAKKRGASLDGKSVDRWKPLPEKMYHVTTARSAVISQGLKTREELDQSLGLGLGGGNEDTVSFTTNEDTAIQIRNALLEARSVARGDISTLDMVDAAETGFGAKKSWLGRLKNYMNGPQNEDRKLMEGAGLDAFNLHVKEIKYEFGAPKLPEAMPGWTPDEKQKLVGGDGKTRYLGWTRPMNEEEKAKNRWYFYQKWSFFRDREGEGPMDPLFFGSDPKALASVDVNEIAIMEFKPGLNSKGYQMGSLEEWRTHSGKAVELVREVDKGRTLTGYLFKMEKP